MGRFAMLAEAKEISAVIPRDQDGYCAVYKMACTDGLGLMTAYQVYPGIQVIYNDFEAASCRWDTLLGKTFWRSITAEREGKAAGF